MSENSRASHARCVGRNARQHSQRLIKEKVKITTTDNGSNSVKAFSVFAEVQINSVREEENEEGEEDDTVFINLTDILNEEDGDEDVSLPLHQRCACHTLNLVATKDIETAVSQSEPFKKVSRSTIGKCQAIWNKQHRSAHSRQDRVPAASAHFNSLEFYLQCHGGPQHLYPDKTSRIQQNTCEKLQVVRFKAAEFTFIKEYVQVNM